MSIHHERTFQTEIAEALAKNGWLHSPNSAGYDKERALFPEDLLAYLSETQHSKYVKAVPDSLTGAARATAEAKVLDALVMKLEQPEKNGGGTLAALRKGFDVIGAGSFRVLTPPVASNLNPELTAHYKANRLRVVEEVVYSTKKSDRIDLVLFVNGIPVATLELKADTQQSVNDAIAQYKRDRSPKNEPLLTPIRGALVHFAASHSEVYMTTMLDGGSTRFLPFNRGHNNGAGNPLVEGDVQTSYLWNEIFQRDAWIQLLTSFIYIKHETVEDPTTGRITRLPAVVRFPRYHQWRAVTKLVRAAREEGPGHKYLIQHSAGSGKTDSIAWTAHRLAELHDDNGNKVFDSVIVIADRKVLDDQLHDAVRQLEKSPGTFVPVTSGTEGSKTSQLTDALQSGTPIIGVTLQTFPYVLEKLKKEPGSIHGKHFAVIADEAHSSQSGSTRAAIGSVLYGSDYDDAPEAEFEADQDALNKMASRSDAQGRLSFFAFTATPKATTLQTFGRIGESGKHEPFDVYSMKQAIQEGFILDVLKNYTTYDMAAQIAKAGTDPNLVGSGAVVSGKRDHISISDDAELDERAGTRAYINFVQHHPTNVASKVERIIEHFNGVVRHELNGHAKAMVVTRSRASAVQYQRAFQKAIESGGHNLATIVAFSGEVPDPAIPDAPGIERPQLSEASTALNPQLKGGSIPQVFDQIGQHILIVASKYQTGFDQPKLVAMYVDKKLSGIAAVQTLSRLNRTFKGKENTYVLDFVNDPEVILQSFQDYYEEAHIEKEADPYIVVKLANTLEHAGIFSMHDVAQVWEAQATNKNLKFNAALQPPIDSFRQAWTQSENDDERRTELEEFYAGLRAYTKAYDFFSQILFYGDPRFEKLSLFCAMLHRSLSGIVAGNNIVEVVNVDDVVLSRYSLTHSGDHDLELKDGEGRGLNGQTETGSGKRGKGSRKKQSELIAKVNLILGKDLNAEDSVIEATLQAIAQQLSANPKIAEQASANTPVDFYMSNTLQREFQDTLWKTEIGTNEVINALRDSEPEKQRLILESLGLWEKFHQASA